VNALLAAALYGPLGISGIVIGTVVGTVGMTAMQGLLLRPDLGGIEGRATLAAVLRMLAAAALLGAVTYGIWWVLDEALGRGLWAQVVAVGVGIVAGLAVYATAVWALGIREARQIRDLVAGRLRRGG
jgi:putative peptidoglycan lipid II flippase